jgi:hypothetical protein
VNKLLNIARKHKYLTSMAMVLLILAIAIPIIVAQERSQPVQPAGNVTQEESELETIINVCLIPADTVYDDPQYAREHGIRGLVEIAPLYFPVSMSASRGEHVVISIVIKFTSVDPDLTSVDIIIDPSDEYIGGHSEQCWIEYDEEGKEIARGTVRFSDLISYSKSGVITVRHGEPLVLDMILDIPQDLPPLSSNSIMISGDGIDLKDKGTPVVAGVILWDNFGIENEVKLVD